MFIEGKATPKEYYFCKERFHYTQFMPYMGGKTSWRVINDNPNLKEFYKRSHLDGNSHEYYNCRFGTK